MQWRKIAKWFLYPAYFFFMLCLGLYWTFPLYVLKGYLGHEFEKELAESQKNGEPHPSVRIGDLTLWRFTGVQIKNLEISFPSNDGGKTQWKVDALKARVGFFNSVLKGPTFEVQANLFGGNAAGRIVLGKDESISDFDFEINHIHLDKLPFVDPSKLALKGEVNLYSDLALGKVAASEAKGRLTLNFDDVVVGPGEIPIPGGAFNSGFKIPAIRFGDFKGDLIVDKGKAVTKQLILSGGDIEANANFEVDIHKQAMLSRLSGEGAFSIAQRFLDKNPQFKTLLEVVPDLAASKNAQGKYEFALKGNLIHPQFKFKNSGRPALRNDFPHDGPMDVGPDTGLDNAENL